MNTVKEKVGTALQQEVTRKQFVQIVAGGGLTLFGLGNFLSFFKNITQPAVATDNHHGFGSRKFGV